MREALALGIGYLLGSVLPADILARMRGVDIRAVGTRNPGTTNALRELGLGAGVVTLLYDASVGLLAMWLASVLGVSQGWVYLAGLSAVFGHRFPLFFRFRGGQGMAATTAMLIYEMGVALSQGWLSWGEIALLGAVAIAVFALTRSATMVGVVAVPLLVLEVTLGDASALQLAFVAVLSAVIWVVQLGIAREQHLFRVAAPARAQLARMRVHSRQR